MADDHFSPHTFLQAYEANTSIGTAHSTVTCCCGNASCVFLRHNQTALEGLERDVCTAAKLGKVSLICSGVVIGLQRLSRRCAIL
jgi:hypothetical protein